MRDAEGVEVNTVDTFRVDLIYVVKKDLLHATWVLSDGRGGGHEPAVADRALADIRRGHTVGSKERVASELLSGAMPGETAPTLVALTHVAPVECIAVMGKGLVGKL